MTLLQLFVSNIISSQGEWRVLFSSATPHPSLLVELIIVHLKHKSTIILKCFENNIFGFNGCQVGKNR